jgi:transcriptional regulator with XRE-family HTH domain
MLDLQQRLLLAMRRNPGIRPVDLARACGITTASVAQWRNGRTRSLKGAVARAAADLLGCDRDWLATGAGQPGWRDADKDPTSGPGPSASTDARGPELQWPLDRFPLAYWLDLDEAERAIVQEAMLEARDRLMMRREQLQASRKHLKPAA